MKKNFLSRKHPHKSIKRSGDMVRTIILCLALLCSVDAIPLPPVVGPAVGGAINGVLSCLGRSADPKHLLTVKNQFLMDKTRLLEISSSLIGQMQSGLCKDSDSSLKMLPSHLTASATGAEVGEFLALDLGGTNFRVLKVKLEGNSKSSVEAGKFKVDEALMTGPGADLFAFIAQKIKEQVPEAVDAEKPMHLGFTFSFPVEQPSIDAGTLLGWTKGFTCSGVEGQDVCGLLRKALADEKLNIKVSALVNDTPGTMLAGGYSDPSVCAGLILGTGTNACYLEKVSKAPKLQTPKEVNSLPSVVTWSQPPHLPGGSNTHIINMEWGNFGAGSSMASLPLSAYDVVVDRKSPNPGKQLFEKMISGMYLGEIARLIATDLIAKDILFAGQAHALFLSPGEFSTELMANIEGSDNAGQIAEMLKSHGIAKATKRDCKILKEVCSMVSTRAARLSAAGVAAIALHQKRTNDCTVAVDGTVFLKYPHFKDRMMGALREMLGKNMGVRFTTTSDGSGIGAAIAAATTVA